MNKILYHIDMSKSQQDIKSELDKVWGEYMAYHIYNVPEMDIEKTYENIAESLGTIRLCHSVNGKTTKFSKSRDIKPNPDLYHYFAANTRQPLHTDYAYYKQDEAPEWLMLYCMSPSEFGGKTHLLSTQTLTTILKKYDPTLLEDIKANVKWEYTGDDGDKIHQKPIFNGKQINWNYWQIKEELNSKKVMKTREKFFNFLEKKIVDGGIYDFSKIWNVGDCLIFNDRLMLHGRDAFLGNKRWLKDHAFFPNNIKN